MLVGFYHASHNTQMLGIKYSYLIINKNGKDSFEFFNIRRKILKNKK